MKSAKIKKVFLVTPDKQIRAHNSIAHRSLSTLKNLFEIYVESFTDLVTG